ncbi:MAG: hypothetical protein H6546_03020 [Chitinophagales bacterium]|nr:hypothetical protein [Chitinophagales bacterium]
MEQTTKGRRRSKKGTRRLVGLVNTQTKSNQVFNRLRNSGYEGTKEDFQKQHDEVVEYIKRGLLQNKIFRLGRLGYLFIRMKPRKSSKPLFSCGLRNYRRANGDPDADGYYIPEKYSVKIMWSKYKIITPGSRLTIFRPAVEFKKAVSKARKKGTSFIIWDEYESYKENLNRQSDPGGPDGPGDGDHPVRDH